MVLSEKAYSRLRQEKERPKTATLKEAQQHILPHLETTFKKFWEVSQGHEGHCCAIFWILLKSEAIMNVECIIIDIFCLTRAQLCSPLPILSLSDL